ncbi:MAG: DUF4867 family protein [Lachnospiraceae bacterium]|nr:DUF4867 family protein [Lachnospiraceae bacterium]
MEIKQITDPSFRKYGRIIKDVDFSGLVEKLMDTPLPEDVVYVASVPELEALPVFEELKTKVYGELPIQVGYCNGHNHKLNAFEYHRCSEINVAAMDAVLILGAQQDITEDFTYDTSKAEAFLLPKGTAVEVYATTLHYAPCNQGDAGFRVSIVLPKGTNTDLEKEHADGEDGLLTAKNKWLLGHPEGGLPEGSPMGLTGENLTVE